MSGQKCSRRFIVGAGAAMLAVAAALVPLSLAQQIHRNPFETDEVSWIKGNADAAFEEKQHVRTGEVFNSGQKSELIQIESKAGSYIYYQYPLGKAPVDTDLTVGVWIKSNRPNLQLLARLVLPKEHDPKSLGDCLTTLIRGDSYRLTGRWQRLELSQPVALMKKQQQIMQNQMGRPINFEGAYIDSLLLNVYGGPGSTNVWIDDLEAGPIVESMPAKKTPTGPGQLTGQTKQTHAAAVKFDGTQLFVNDKRYFFRMIRHSDMPLPVLRHLGFNTVSMPYGTAPAVLHEAAQQGFLLAPSLPVASGDKQSLSLDAAGHFATAYPERDAVLFWDLGTSLASEQAATVAKAAQIVRQADPNRPIGGDVWDGFSPYSRNNLLNLVSAHRWPLMTGLELTAYREWLEQRRQLANPGTFLWTWVQTHTPEFFSQLLYHQSAAKSFGVPVGPDPAQIRLLTYTALGAGCRGLGFWSDRFLSESHQGLDRQLAVAILNKELELLEPLLVTIDGPPAWIPTSEKEVQAAVFRTAKGILVVPMWLGRGAQFVPGQSATNKLEITVPQIPPDTQVWEITPGDVRSLQPKRAALGEKLVLDDFDLTTAVVFTPDLKLIKRFQDHCAVIRRQVAQWTYEQAVEEKRKVDIVQAELAKVGRVIPQAEALLKEAQKKLESCRMQMDNQVYSEAYREARRAQRPLRIIMRAQWENAIRFLDSPVSVPQAVSYYTLPAFWQEVQQLRQASPGANVLPGGDFEDTPSAGQPSWSPFEVATLDEVVQKAQRVGKDSGDKIEPKKGQLCAMLSVTPKTPDTHLTALERTYMAINSPVVKLPPGTLVKISAWIHIPKAIQASVDGVLFFDSSAGEPLAIRLTQPTPWRQFSLYRRVPASGALNVTLALSGLGTAYFDDVRVEPMTATDAAGH